MRSTWWGSAVVATMLVAAGCGGAAGYGPTPIRIGGLMAVTGIDIPNYLAAARAAAREIDAHGGVRGRPIEIDNQRFFSPDPLEGQLNEPARRELAALWSERASGLQ